jgi:hypothetical protein
MFDRWEQRRQKVLENTSTKKLMFRPLSEILKELPSESSEDRLEALPDGSWTPALFIAAARALLAHSMFAGTLHRQGDALPALGDGVILKYAGEYDTYIEEINDRTDLVVSVVREGDRVIAFAGAELRQDEAGSSSSLSMTSRVDSEEYDRRWRLGDKCSTLVWDTPSSTCSRRRSRTASSLTQLTINPATSSSHWGSSSSLTRAIRA